MEINKRNQEIIDGLKAGKSGSDLAREYGVSPSTISKIKKDYLTGGGSLDATAAPAKTTKKEVPVQETPVVAKEATFESVEGKEEFVAVRERTIFITTLNKNQKFTSTAPTFGHLLEDIKSKNIETAAMDIIFRDNKSSISTMKQQLLPDTDDIYLFILPNKVKAG